MKKQILLLICALSSTLFVTAQEFGQGTNVINAGIGLGGDFDVYRGPSESPGFSVSYERGIWEVGGPGVISLGGYLGFKAYKYDNDDRWRYTIIGVRGAYHFLGLDVDNLDVYGGVMASYNILSYDNDTYDAFGDFSSRPGGTVFVGGRWYFTEAFGVFAEAGYGAAFLTAGASLRF
ncbi:hypothetical protein [Pareuzebyella sediminis]|uniref:hypothetical protein n=1 Tax=Pareuzebyella sediminis TaxID=2607998 RepID=UPI0011EE1127|nr:hypothetical protein [Pareuzebyella sediminis]